MEVAPPNLASRDMLSPDSGSAKFSRLFHQLGGRPAYSRVGSGNGAAASK